MLSSDRLPPHFSQYGFLDQSVTRDNRLLKGAEQPDHSLENFRLAARQDLDAADYAHLYFAYFNMATSYHYRGDRAQACDWMSKSVDAADENDRRTPKAKVSQPHREPMRAFLKHNACGGDAGATTS